MAPRSVFLVLKYAEVAFERLSQFVERVANALKLYRGQKAFLTPDTERFSYVHPEFPHGKYGRTHLR